jgi:2-C-methyl-D-erythritol 4-phosphate cytidylyltransferase/2-C-methyl-D-erythritol 2,4-cyclodiphosphate synthase
VTVFAILLAAGESSRYRLSDPGGGNKLFARLSGREIWRAAYDVLATHPRISGVGIVGPENFLNSFSDSGAAFVVAGGITRRDSCVAGLLQAPANALVLVHDAARPFVTHELIDRVIDSAEKSGAAIPCVPIVDTIKHVAAGKVRATMDRSMLFRAQTPQAARRELLIEALDAHQHATDEASALESYGIEVAVVDGDEANVKITTAADLDGSLSRERTTLVGSGFDIHALSQDLSRTLVLGGVEFPESQPLAGHSDADVVLHALTDALLGAIGEGDIGLLFPNTDPRYAGADSTLFLREAVQRVRAAGASVINADITILAESPKLGDRRGEIQNKISKELGVPPRRVNIKATTMEQLGAIGRQEGIAAMATVTVVVE